mgnify:FL=1
MNKKFLTFSLLSFCGLFLASVFSFASYPGEKTLKRKAFVRFAKNIYVNHRHIQRISPYGHEPNFVAVGSYESAAVTDAKIEYYINNDTTTAAFLPLEEVRTPFVSAKFTLPSSASEFSYRFVFIENNNPADPKYYPYNANEWIHAPVTDHSKKVITAAGGKMILDNGDQRYGYSEAVFNPNSFSADCLIKLSESDMNAFAGDKTGLVKLYEFDSAYPLRQNARITLYYGSSNDGHFTVKYLNGNKWENINLPQSQDPLKKTVSFYAKERGFYGIFVKTADDDAGYRPHHRVLRFGESLKPAGDRKSVV